MTEKTATQEYRLIGSSPQRYDAADKATGRARFGPDVQLPGLLHGKVLRSPHAHARILSIDTSRAEALPGVYAVVTAQDLEQMRGEPEGNERPVDLQHRLDNTLASTQVLYAGQAVAAVAAETPHLAEQALALIEVDYQVLPAVTDVLEAAQDGAPLLHEHMHTQSLAGESETASNIASHFQLLKGDPETGFAQADAVVEREFRTAMVHQGYIEPHATTATW
ncbi:MAG: xanthine dehydrogenase family protein molybdopterin-binding subunit, partial [Anaerolineae bacterium]